MHSLCVKHLYEDLRDAGIKFCKDQDTSKIGTIRIGGIVSLWCEPANSIELAGLLRLLKRNALPHMVAGNCSNLLFPDGSIELAVIRLVDGEFKKIEIKQDRLICGSGVLLSEAIKVSTSYGLSGLEDLVGIPATCGGACAMNASSLIAMEQIVERVTIMDEKGDIYSLSTEDAGLSYRSSDLLNAGKIIVSVTFKLRQGCKDEIKKRLKKNIREKMTTQPLTEKSLGCVFKNPQKHILSAGEFLDRAGLKGMRYGGAEYSMKHANFICNRRNATSCDVRHLIKLGKKKVRDKYKVELKEEIQVIGNDG